MTMMKKLLAILMALTLCLVSFASLAEGDAAADEAEETEEVAEGEEAAEGDGEEIPALETTISFEAQEVAIGDTGLTLSIPTDWVAQEAPEGALLVYQNADGTLAMTVSTAAMDLDTLWDTCSAQIEEGTGKNLMEAYVNDNYFILYELADGVTSLGYTSLDDANILAIAFQAASADISTAVAQEILGSLAGGEEAAE